MRDVSSKQAPDSLSHARSVALSRVRRAHAMLKTPKTLLNDACLAAGAPPATFTSVAATQQGPFTSTVSLPQQLWPAGGAFTGDAASSKKAAEQAAAAAALAALGVSAAPQSAATVSVADAVAAALRNPTASASLWALARATPCEGAWRPLSTLLLLHSVRAALARVSPRRHPCAALAALQAAVRADAGAACTYITLRGVAVRSRGVLCSQRLT
jgi:hypothetical protein